MAPSKRKSLFPFALTPDVIAAKVDDLVREVIAESDRQVEGKGLVDPDLAEEFEMACDALGCRRMELRFLEELGLPGLDRKTALIYDQLCEAVANTRGYTEDDFASALQATRDRAKLPWGFTSLRLAYNRAQRSPLRLLDPKLKDAPLPTLLAGIAFQLDEMRRQGEVLLMPVDSLRAMLAQRKLVVGGALQRLIEAGILEVIGKRYGTGRAREFKFAAKEGKDFELVHEEPAADAATPLKK